MPSVHINQQSLIVSLIQNGGRVKDDAPKAIPLLLDFTGIVDRYILDATLFQERAFIKRLQTLWLDLNASANDLTVIVNHRQQIVAKAGTQGYYPILSSNPIHLVFVSNAGGVEIPVQLINVPICSCAPWPG